LAFPASPTNGQNITASNGITYVYSTSTNAWSRVSTGSAGGSSFTGGTITNSTTISSTTASSSTSTGALTVVGGVGIGGGLYVGGVVTATNIFVGGYAVSTASSLTIQSAGVGQGTAATINFSTGLTATVATNVATVTLTTSTLMTTAVNLAGGAVTATNIVVSGTTNTTSTTTGAVQVAGGLAVAKDLYVGGTIITASEAGGDFDMGGGDIVNVGRITASTGTFTTILSTGALTVTGTSNLGAVGNVNISGGTNGYNLQTNGSGTLSWNNPTGYIYLTGLFYNTI